MIGRMMEKVSLECLSNPSLLVTESMLIIQSPREGDDPFSI